MPSIAQVNPLPQGLAIVDKSGAATHELWWFLNQLLASVQTPISLFVDLPVDAEDGSLLFCPNAKNFHDNAAAVGSIAVTGGAGTLLVWLNGSWRTMA